MKRTVTALYETRPDAERALEALKQHGLAGEADICDLERSDREGPHGEHGLHGRMHSLFGRHKDAHAYGEGLRRGHFLLTAKVEDERETIAAEMMEAAQPLDLAQREQTWRSEGWTPPAHSAPQADTAGVLRQPDDTATSFGPGIKVRSYVTTNTTEYSSPASRSPGQPAVEERIDPAGTGANTSS